MYNPFSKSDRKKRKEAKLDKKKYRSVNIRKSQYRFLSAGDYKFYSDYFTINDKRFGTILTLVKPDSSDRAREPFWFNDLIPRITGIDGAVGHLFQSYNNMPKKWVEKGFKNANFIRNQENGIIPQDNSQSDIARSYRDEDLSIISFDDLSGASYAAIEFKVVLYTDSLEDLELAVRKYEQQISDDANFGGLHFVTIEGGQYNDFVRLYHSGWRQVGSNRIHKMASSTEYAGGYNILTQGLDDSSGEYIGSMQGDFNNPAVLMDVDNFDDHVVISSDANAVTVSFSNDDFDRGTKSSTLWGLKLAQSALINNHRVVHIVLNDAKIQNIGADLSSITSVVSVNKGAVNPFHIFGDVSNELSLYPEHNQKMRLMVSELSDHEVTATDLNKTLGDILELFYGSKRMWTSNAKENRDYLRIAGLAYDKYPRVSEFMTYLSQQEKTAKRMGDKFRVDSISRLQGAFSKMADENADIFDVYSDPALKNLKDSRQVIFDFSSLSKRGESVTMAELINVFDVAVQDLTKYDMVVFHGTDHIRDSVKKYLKNKFSALKSDGVRLVFLYDNTETCIKDHEFNNLVKADYTAMGSLSKPLVELYTDTISEGLPRELIKIMTDQNSSKGSSSSNKDTLYYLHRGIDHILFDFDPILGERAGGMISANPQGLLTERGNDL